MPVVIALCRVSLRFGCLWIFTELLSIFMDVLLELYKPLLGKITQKGGQEGVPLKTIVKNAAGCGSLAAYGKTWLVRSQDEEELFSKLRECGFCNSAHPLDRAHVSGADITGLTSLGV